MSSNINQAVYCAACGGPLDDYRDDRYHLLYQAEDLNRDEERNAVPYQGPWIITKEEMKWLAYVWLIGKVTDRSEDEKTWLRGINRQPEQPESDFFVRMARWNGSYCVWILDYTSTPPRDIDVYYHRKPSGFADFPIHVACLSIVERVVERRRRQGYIDKPTSLEEMYERINSVSADSQTARGDLFPYSVAWSHGYYGAEDCQGQYWQDNDGTEWLCADPLNVPSLTAYILGRLRETTSVPPTRVQDPASTADDDDSTFTAMTSGLIIQETSFLQLSALEVLPLELLCKLSSYLPFNSVLALSRTSKTLYERLLTQTFWRNSLITGDVIGYLWDLDGSECRAKGEAELWDWRSLARELARKDCFEHGGAFQDVPRALKNRQRIWKILADV